MKNKLTRVRPENERGSASRCPGRAGCNHNGGADDDDGMRDRWSTTTVTLRPHTKTSPNKPSEAPPLSSFLKRDPAGPALQDQRSFARSLCPAEKCGPLYQFFFPDASIGQGARSETTIFALSQNLISILGHRFADPSLGTFSSRRKCIISLQHTHNGCTCSSWWCTVDAAHSKASQPRS